MTRIRWLKDEGAIAFLLRTDHGVRIYLNRIGSEAPEPLSPEGEDVLSFDIRDRHHYVFTLVSRETRETLNSEQDSPFRVGTGHRSYEAMFPRVTARFVGRAELWAANGGSPAPVRPLNGGKPIILYEPGSDALALSPDGATLITIRPVAEVSKEWETRFPPPFAGSAYRLRAGHQNLDSASGSGYVGE
jgi:hypothetical protein